MTFLKNIFGKSKKARAIPDTKLVQMWWWHHNAQCGRIVVQLESLVDNDILLVVFVNDAGEHWTHVIEIDGEQLITFEIDYTTIRNAKKETFSGKVNSIMVYWKHYQQKFVVRSFLLVSSDEEF